MLNRIELHCPECESTVRRVRRVLVCSEGHEVEERDLRFPCPTVDCTEKASIIGGASPGRWEPKVGTRHGRVFRGSMNVMCEHGHRNSVERPEELSLAYEPKRPSRRAF